MKNTIIAVVIILLVGAGIGWYAGWFGNEPTTAPEQSGAPSAPEPSGKAEEQPGEPTEQEETDVIGKSAEGADITKYHYGSGENELLFVGGMHGGYSWNTALLAFELIDYLEANPDVIPKNITVTVIPVMNPDGLKRVVGTTGRFTKADVKGNTVPGRFNGNDVDLNRNFDCNWKKSAIWRNTPVNAGSGPFSEPETQALRDYIEARDISAAIFWYSSAGGVYESRCNGTVLPETKTLLNTFANASGYPASGYFTAYAITGDSADWLSKIGIPAISVILDTHDQVEWEKNRKGIEALLKFYATSS